MDLFAASAPGISRITAGELAALGIAVREVLADGVVFSGDDGILTRANVWLRTASRILVRMGTFHARTFTELERHAAKLDWDAFAARGVSARFRVTARKCRLYHTGAIVERLARSAGIAAVADGGDASAQLFVVRGLRDQWVVSADSSGEHLHRRGYRLATARAPLRETLAAAALLASGWNVEAPLVDPFCGSGTICIEGALMAGGRPPGAKREFAFTRWPSYRGRMSNFDASRPVPAGVHVHGYDRDAGAIESATGNSRRAGVESLIDFRRQPVSELTRPATRGWIVTNPPYGVRVGERAPLRNLYARFGAVVRERCGGWTVAFYSADRTLERATGLPLETLLRTENGGLPVRLVVAEIR